MTYDDAAADPPADNISSKPLTALAPPTNVARTGAASLSMFTYDVIVQYAYFGEAERASRIAETIEMLVVQHQAMDNLERLTTSHTNFSTTLDFNFPVCSMVVTAQSGYRKAAGQAGDFRGFPDGATCSADNFEGHPHHLLSDLQILFNNNVRQSSQEPGFYTALQPSLHAKCVPKENHLHLFSFGLGPSPYELIAGTANFSRLSTVKIGGNAATDAFLDHSTLAAGVNKSEDSILIHCDVVSVNVGHFSAGQFSIHYAS
tara:strand:- start:71 stop:850 length:780 start_codon:yes stop_codon:yes gene_type:complete